MTLRAKAAVLETREDVEAAPPGLYVARSGTPAYFPLLALIEADEAELMGELFEDGARVVTVEVTSAPEHGLGQPSPQRRSITIGREFFLTALKDYKDWPIKWWREAIQNSVDAGAENVALGVAQNADGTWTISCDDDGRGMTEDVIINKFLVLGATTKAEEAGVGGFGKAKELLLLPWISWRVHSRETVVEGAGIDYEVMRGAERRGTRLEVVMPADKTTTEAMAIAFIERCYIPHVSFTVNGEPHLADLAARDLIRSLEGKADIFFSRGVEKQAYIYVRARGVFMFERYVGEVPGYVIAELIAPSIEILTANRDGFRDWQVGSEVDQLAEKIAKDNLSALQAKQGLIRQKFEGAGKFRAKRLAAGLLEQVGPTPGMKLSEHDEQGILHAITDYHQRDEQDQRPTNVPSPETAAAMLDVKLQGPSHLEAAIKQLVWEPDFYLVNDIEGFKVPKKFFPATMTPRVLKLAKTWVELCRFVFIQLGSDVDFGVGFIFSPNTAAAAMCEEGEKWLMLNPFKEMTESDIWRPAADADLKWLYAAAIHEATHISDHINYHDESFASALTRNMARCADGYRKIRQIVAGIRMHGGIEADV
jgi:hypothetical protein